METIRTVEWMKQVSRQARAEGRLVGFVPTMGALHAGHASLVRAAQRDCSPVVVSIFVNPAQFGPGEDFAKYPRAREADTALVESLGAEFLFAPEAAEIYPPGFSSYVEVAELASRLEGRARPGHFRGVATVVLKLLEIVQPWRAYFGRKDAQQARIVLQLTRDFNLDAQIEVCPIVREPDGLALSSRNAYLSPEDRRAAVVLFRALAAARECVGRGEREARPLVAAMREVLAQEPRATPDYAEVVSADTFEPVAELRGECYALLAAAFGGTRLLDNMLIEEQDGNFRCKL
ncbi:MAG TPA: pantoate--beta-alanine ligase [Candidatus Acidoferrales bacterium]|nr:pantoate--beta-alanine ligase [Candidatus Acidoferrales bacterium]